MWYFVNQGFYKNFKLAHKRLSVTSKTLKGDDSKSSKLVELNQKEVAFD